MKLSSNVVETGIYLLRKTGPVGIQEIVDPSKIPKESFYNYFSLSLGSLRNIRTAIQ
ncbi:hypothetical protein [Leptospira borgpetersenii]|uniref:Uncharacterized protein n=1 Tax=Leptospira borgpetersenii serovar Javanica str. UI 09931 TaxID=1049767 RepID=A0AAV3J555_LEPBO|nr:hypothetical protein [Leptospira borgpetersenii]EPG56033.1 hypothetical protein LEP1GSC103_0870 [Leptospira borgpetersenii serovar Javanica str. UI 09931]